MLTNEQLIDTIVNDCNTALKELFNGQYVVFSQTMVVIVQKLINLKTGIANDLKNRDMQIEDYKKMLKDNGIEIVDMPVEDLPLEG